MIIADLISVFRVFIFGHLGDYLILPAMADDKCCNNYYGVKNRDNDMQL